MIGRARGLRHPSRGVLLGLAGIIAIGAALSQRSPIAVIADPVAAAAARATFDRARATAVEALDRLDARLQAALAEGRRGSALTVAGDGRPGPHLRAAGELLAGEGSSDDPAAERLAAAARMALAAVAGQLAILSPDAAPPSLEVGAGALAGIGSQLAASADAADAFRAMREASQATLAALGAALAALDRSDLGAARTALDQADGQLRVVQAWPGELVTLPIWIETTSALLAAARRIASAAAAGDAAALERARAAYRSAAEDAHRADLALAIAIAEGGSAVSGAPLRSLGGVIGAVDAASAALAAIGRPG